MSTFSKLNTNHKLFKSLKEQDLVWWQHLKNDKHTYIEVRKDNYLDLYYNGGRILELKYTNPFKGKIHFEYLPLQNRTEYVLLTFRDGVTQLQDNGLTILDLDNFSPDSLQLIQKRISKFYPPGSEKAIQADFRLRNKFFIDSEFQYGSSIRFDLIWVDIRRKRLFAVELKTIGDQRLYFNEKSKNSNDYSKIDSQLHRYREFILDYKEELVSHYERVILVKQDLDLVSPELVQLNSLAGFSFEPRPILLVGDCTQVWIDQNSKRLNDALRDVAFGCIYQGVNTRTFIIPEKSRRNRFIFA